MATLETFRELNEASGAQSRIDKLVKQYGEADVMEAMWGVEGWNYISRDSDLEDIYDVVSFTIKNCSKKPEVVSVTGDSFFILPNAKKIIDQVERNLKG